MGIRLDLYLSEKLGVSRSQALQLIKKGKVKLNGEVVKKGGVKVEEGDRVEWELPEPEETPPPPPPDFEIPILYEDEYLLVVNKPAGVVVHPAPSYSGPTLVDWLKSRGYRLSTIGGEERVGIVHRLDKGTSGALVVAKDNKTHQNLSSQLERREMGRYYLMLLNQPISKPVIVEKPIGRNPKDRKKMAVVPGGRYAKTLFIPIYQNLVLAKLFTGRTHQIRVHLKELGRWILGDSLYGKGEGERVMLHAFKLYLTHPATGEQMEIEAPLFPDFKKAIGEEGITAIKNLPPLAQWTQKVERDILFPPV